MAALGPARRGPTYNPVAYDHDRSLSEIGWYRTSAFRPTSMVMMTLAIHDQRLAKPGPQSAALRDYDSVRRAIAFISEHWRRSRPSRRWRMPPASRRTNCTICSAAGPG